jgi:ribosomal protein S18 acetylase RimI-like enzyme
MLSASVARVRVPGAPILSPGGLAGRGSWHDAVMRIVELGGGDESLLGAAVLRFRGADGIDHGLFLADPGTVALVAVDGEQVEGWAWGQRERHVCGYSQLLLYEIEVAAAARRQGVGRALISAFLAIGRREGHAKMWLFTRADNSGAKALYQSAGGIAAADDETGFSWELTPRS